MWCSVPAVKCTVPSMWCSVPAVKCTVPSMWCSVPAVKCTVPSMWCSVPAVKCTVPSMWLTQLVFSIKLGRRNYSTIESRIYMKRQRGEYICTPPLPPHHFENMRIQLLISIKRQIYKKKL